MAEDDDIPDLFPGARPAARPSSSVAPPQSRAPAGSSRPPAASVPPSSPLSSGSGPSSFDLASLDEGEASPGPAEADADEFEFDLLGATSQSSDALLAGAGLGELPLPTPQARSPVASPGSAQPVRSAASAALDFSLDAGASDGGLGDLDFELGPAAPSARRSSYPAPARPSVAPAQSVPPARSVPPSQHFPGPASGAFAPSSSGGAASWDLDEALGIAPAIDLTVAVPTAAETSGDGPWPHGTTPADEDLRIDAEDIDTAAGFGPRPGSVLTTPLYFIRVTLGKRQLLAQLAAEQPELTRLEHDRDQILAALALELRPQLDDKERFARLYSEVDKYDAMIAQREADLHATDQRGSSRLADLERSLREAQGVVEEKTRLANEERAVHAEADRLARRARAQANRLQIELRNVEDLARQRAAPGAPMPQDLALRFVAVEAEYKAAMASAAAAEADVKVRVAPLARAEDEARRARADLQRIEGEREGYIMAHEGDMSDAGGSLETARRGRLQELSRAACAVLELRGEVPVAVEVRRRIAQADRLVEVAAQKAALYRRALASADETAVATGRFVWLALGAALLVSLILAALR